MRSFISPSKISKLISCCGIALAAISTATAEPVANAVLKAEQASVGGQPGVIPILALSVAAITMMRRRVRQ